VTSGKRTPEHVRLSIQRLAAEKDADGHWLLSYEEIGHRLKIDRAVVSQEIREAARQWWHVSRWRPDSDLA
jgi:hypothetical protein